MLSRWQFGVVVALALATLVLTVANMVLFSRNRAQQTEVNNRQLFIQQTAQVEGLYQQLIRAIAEIATRNSDAALGAVLTRQGITITATSVPQPSPSDAGATTRAPRK